MVRGASTRPSFFYDDAKVPHGQGRCRLKVSDSDLVLIRRQAKENLQKHIDERIPEEYEKYIAGMNTVLKMTSYIANTVADPRTKLHHCRTIVTSTNWSWLQMVLVTDAIKYIQGQMDHLDKTGKARLQDIKEDREKEEQEDRSAKNTQLCILISSILGELTTSQVL